MPKQTRRRPDPKRLDAFLNETGLSFSANGRSYVFTCPRCHKADKLWMFQDGSSFVCFSGSCSDANFSGAVEYALKELTNRSLEDVRYAIYGDTYIAAEGFRFVIGEEEDQEEIVELPMPDLAWPLDYYPLDAAAAAPGVAYLVGRGILPDLAAEYGIRYSVDEKAIAFPVLVGEQLVGWQLRFLQERVFRKAERTIKQKVWTLPGTPRSRVVMFQNRLEGSDACVLCEGPVDGIKAHYVGGNIASMGKKVGDRQIDVIRRSGVQKVYVALDPDAAADFEPLARKFDGLDVFKVVVPKPYKDLGEMPIDEATDTILAAEPLSPRSIHFFFG
jgi:hypothetical protein